MFDRVFRFAVERAGVTLETQLGEPGRTRPQKNNLSVCSDIQTLWECGSSLTANRTAWTNSIVTAVYSRHLQPQASYNLRALMPVANIQVDSNCENCPSFDPLGLFAST